MRKPGAFIKIAPRIVLLFFFAYFFFQVTKFYQKYRLIPDLKVKIQDQLKSSGFRCSLVIKDLDFPGLRFEIDSEKKIPAASLIKLPILAGALKAVEEGKVSLQDEVVIKGADTAGGSGKLKAAMLPLTLTFEKLLEFMISSSDNTATNKVIHILGFEYLNNSFKDFNLNETVLTRKMMDFTKRRLGIENYTSSRDIVLLLDRIYNKKLVNKRLSRLALEFLKKQSINDRLSRYLPNEAIIAHKTGLERGVVHDAGIIFAPEGNYIICVLLSKVKNYKKAKKFIAQTSLFTYNLYQ